MAHGNAALTRKHRLRLERRIVEDGSTPARAAALFTVAWDTADRRAQGYRDKGQPG